MRTRLALFALVTAPLAACGTGLNTMPAVHPLYAEPAPVYSSPPPAARSNEEAASVQSAPRASSTRAEAFESAPPPPPSPTIMPAAPDAIAQTSPPAPEPRPDRPGLGTDWGETRYSPVHEVGFERASSEPFSVATVYYNDRDGVNAMAAYDARHGAPATIPIVVRGGLEISVVNEAGDPLPAVSVGGHVYVVGSAGQRYELVIRNLTGRRYEAVLSVDGLDVVDGKAASLGKRGYLIAPWTTITVDGFRQSDDSVAAFRFGSVRDSYAAKTAGDRDVGVIGWAFFDERGATAWSDDEIERRLTARPFTDSRYAQPPPF